MLKKHGDSRLAYKETDNKWSIGYDGENTILL